MSFLRLPLLATVAGVFLAVAHASRAQVTTAQYDNARTGVTHREVTLTPRNVDVATFGKIGRYRVNGDVYAQPLFLPQVPTMEGRRADLLIVATEAGSVYGFDASTSPPSSRPLWRTSFVDSSKGITPVGSRDVQCPFIKPDISITPTPVIDTTSGLLYVLVRTKEGADGSIRYVQRLHALDVRTGKDRLPPVEIEASVPGRGDGSSNGLVVFDPLRENPRAALLLSRGVVYLSWASSCDVGPYHGWVMAYDAHSLKRLASFNTSPNGTQAGVWQGDAGLAADSAGDVYAATGNGTFNSVTHDFGNTILKLRLGPTGLEVKDYFTTSNQAALTASDDDLGSSGPVLIDDDSGPRKHLLFLSGKAGLSYVIDRDAMGHFHPGTDQHAVQTMISSGGGFGAAAYWHHTVYVWGSFAALKAYPIVNGRFESPDRGPTTSPDPGATPVVSANGDRDGLVWAIETRSWLGDERPALLHAYDARDVRREIYSSARNQPRDRAGLATRFAIPTVANGRVYVGDRGGVTVYGLLH